MSQNNTLKKKIIDLRKAGKTYNQIQKILNCSKGTISYHCEAENLTDIGKKQVNLTEQQKLAIAEFCSMNPMKIAVPHFGLSTSTINKYKNYKIAQ